MDSNSYGKQVIALPQGLSPHLSEQSSISVLSDYGKPAAMFNGNYQQCQVACSLDDLSLNPATSNSKTGSNLPIQSRLDQIGNADYILSGTIRRNNDTLRLGDFSKRTNEFLPVQSKLPNVTQTLGKQISKLTPSKQLNLEASNGSIIENICPTNLTTTNLNYFGNDVNQINFKNDAPQEQMRMSDKSSVYSNKKDFETHSTMSLKEPEKKQLSPLQQPSALLNAMPIHKDYSFSLVQKEQLHVQKNYVQQKQDTPLNLKPMSQNAFRPQLSDMCSHQEFIRQQQEQMTPQKMQVSHQQKQIYPQYSQMSHEIGQLLQLPENSLNNKLNLTHMPQQKPIPPQIQLSVNQLPPPSRSTHLQSTEIYKSHIESEPTHLTSQLKLSSSQPGYIPISQNKMNSQQYELLPDFESSQSSQLFQHVENQCPANSDQMSAKTGNLPLNSSYGYVQSGSTKLGQHTFEESSVGFNAVNAISHPNQIQNLGMVSESQSQQQAQMLFQKNSKQHQHRSGHLHPPTVGQSVISSSIVPLASGRPGYNQIPGTYQQLTQLYQQPQSVPRRLDPDQMPNPVQVMIENQRNAGGLFATNQLGLVPPLVTTKYTVKDQGNSSPRFIRSTLYCVPTTADLQKNTALPFSLIVSPFARPVEDEYEPPIVDLGDLGPIRCNRCKAYMSPNMQFIDAGRRFQCLMCKVSTEVPTEYFQHLDHTGQRVDKYERPEQVLGTYEFAATKDYCRNNVPPETPAFVFVIDVSYNTIKSGLVQLLCSEMNRILKHLPVDQGHNRSNMRVGFITYNSTVHFYNIKSSLAQPQMMVVGDVQDMFMPLLDGFLCNPEDSELVITALMEQIPKMFADTKETETILFPAIQAGLEAFKASNCAGKLLVFNSSLPIADAPGKLKNREDRKLLGTEKERTVLTPQNSMYSVLGQDCVQFGCSVDYFIFNNSYIDMATIGQVSRLTGGEVYKYTYFQAESDGRRLIEDIIKNISRPIAFDSVMRVRSSAGIRATDFFGHYFMSNTTDVELASIDSTKSIAIEVKHDDKLSHEENVYFQIALLYTSSSGQRRLRILNLALKASSIISDIFKSCDLDSIIIFFAKQSMFTLMELAPKMVKDNLIHRTAQILACYRKHCTSPTSAGQLILPECLKLLPLYVSCLIKNDAVSGGSDMSLDDRSYVMQFVLSMDLSIAVNYFYPRFIPIHNVDVNETEIPMPIRCTYEKMSEHGAYILENGVYFFIWLGQSLPKSFIQPLFGVHSTQQVDAERFAIVSDTTLAKRIKQIISSIMSEKTRYMKVICVRQNDKLESIFRHFLIEDRGTDGSASYVDFLCHMHKEIKDLLS